MNLDSPPCTGDALAREQVGGDEPGKRSREVPKNKDFSVRPVVPRVGECLPESDWWGWSNFRKMEQETLATDIVHKSLSPIPVFRYHFWGSAERFCSNLLIIKQLRHIPMMFFFGNDGFW